MAALLIIFLTLVAVTSAQLIPRTVVGIVQVTNGNDVGKWGINEFCPMGTYAVGFDLLVRHINDTCSLSI